MSEGSRAARRKSDGFKKIELLEVGRDVEYVAAFRDHQFIEENVATRDAVEDVRSRIGARELIFARLQFPAGIERASHQELP